MHEIEPLTKEDSNSDVHDDHELKSAADDSSDNYETVIDKIGLGLSQYLILLVCGLGNASDAVEILSVSYILPELETSLPTWLSSVLSSLVFAGMLVGGIVIGALSDRWGRKKCLNVTMLINTVFSLAFASTSNVYLMSVSRLMTGFGVGGAVPVVFSWSAETLPALRRGLCLTIVASFWMVGSMLTAGFAWIIIPRYGWQPFAFACAAPPAICLVLSVFAVDESPRFLLVSGREREAIAVLERMAQRNKRKISVHHMSISVEQHGHSTSKVEQLKLLLAGDHLKTLLCLMVIWAGICFGWYGIAIWLPTFFKAKGVVQDLYLSTFLVAASNFPGNVISAAIVDIVGRRYLLAGSMFIAGGFALGMAMVSMPTALVILACVFNGISVGGWNSLDIVSVEVFPTTLRGAAMGVLSAVGRLASLAAQYVHVDGNINLPLYIGCGALFMGCIASLMLPQEPSKKKLLDAF
jgi:MFS transporter, VNT family, synaptic vesicle glycoprotein 2